MMGSDKIKYYQDYDVIQFEITVLNLHNFTTLKKKNQADKLWRVRAGREYGSELNLPQGTFKSKKEIRKFIKEQKQKIETNDIVQIAQIYKNAIEETKQYLKDKKLYIPTVNDYLLTGYNGTIQSVQYLMDKYCTELGET